MSSSRGAGTAFSRVLVTFIRNSSRKAGTVFFSVWGTFIRNIIGWCISIWSHSCHILQNSRSAGVQPTSQRSFIMCKGIWVYGLLDMMISSSNPMKICKVKINCVLYLRVGNEIIEVTVLVFQSYFKLYSLIKSNITLSGFNSCGWLAIFLMILKIFKRMEKCWHCVIHWDIKKIILFLVF